MNCTIMRMRIINEFDYEYDENDCASEVVMTSDKASIKRPITVEETNIFSSYAKKFKKTEKVDEEINQALADFFYQ